MKADGNGLASGSSAGCVPPTRGAGPHVPARRTPAEQLRGRGAEA